VQTSYGVLKRYKKIGIISVCFMLLFILNSIVEASSGFIKRDFDIATVLKDGLFDAFSIEKGKIDLEISAMCSGALLDSCRVTDEYGWRIHPKRRYRQFHRGIDLKAMKGAPVYAPADGVVVKSHYAGGYGRLIELDHGFAWSTRYAHLSKLYVKKGAKVKKGDIIGAIGSTGISTGPHLHFEMIYFNETVDPRHFFVTLYGTATLPYAFANR